MTNFTKKEIEILKLIASGLTSKEIAKLLHNSQSTINHQIGCMIQKIGANNRVELLMYALSNKVIEMPNYLPDRTSDYKIYLVQIKR